MNHLSDCDDERDPGSVIMNNISICNTCNISIFALVQI